MLLGTYAIEKEIDRIRAFFPIGIKVKLFEMSGEPEMPSGLLGKVRFVDDIGQVHIQWENGSRLALHPYEDVFTIIEEEEK